MFTADLNTDTEMFLSKLSVLSTVEIIATSNLEVFCSYLTFQKVLTFSVKNNVHVNVSVLFLFC